MKLPDAEKLCRELASELRARVGPKHLTGADLTK